MLAFVVGVPILAFMTGFVARPIWAMRVVVWPLGLSFVLIALGAMAIRNVHARYGIITLIFVALALNLFGYYGTSKSDPGAL
jgi:hypothetical protein